MFLYFRISVIFAFAPANCFQPAKNVLDTMRKLDAKHKLGKTRKYTFMASFVLLKIWQTIFEDNYANMLFFR